MAATSWVIWLCTCVSYWPFRGAVYYDHCIQMVYYELMYCANEVDLRGEIMEISEFMVIRCH